MQNGRTIRTMIDIAVADGTRQAVVTGDYLIDETTYDEWLRKYNAVFAKDNNNQQEGEGEK